MLLFVDMAKRLHDKLMVKPGKKIRLSDWDPSYNFGWKEEEARAQTEKNIEEIIVLQNILAAEAKHSVLFVLQAMDAGGKDGTIRKVMSGLNPQGCRVTSFKAPTPEELSHDFLWRVHRVCPGKGEIGIFNRSHYEDVLVVRVHGLAPKKVWSQRYKLINEFEHLLASNGTTIRKFYLHISKEEQKQRLEERLADPKKHWKFNPGDLKEREYWKNYMDAFDDAIEKCSTAHAPWFIIPADNKWFRDLAVSSIVLDTLRDLKLEYPEPSGDFSKVVVK